MQYITMTAAALFITTTSLAADKPPKAVRVLERVKTTFPAKSMSDGVRTLCRVLESCSSISDRTVKYTADDMMKARKGDHVRFVFAKPLKIEILRRKLEVSEAVFAKGVFWLVSGKEIVRSTKYTHDKWQPFYDWYRQTLLAD